jgi:hypothetical protein
MTGFIFNPNAMMGYLNQHQLLEKVFEIIITKSAYFYTSLDRKLLILGLISFLKEKVKAGCFDVYA